MKTAVAMLLAGLMAGAGLMHWKNSGDAAALRAEVQRLSKSQAGPATAAAVPEVAAPPVGTGAHASKSIEKIITVKVPDEATRQELVRLLDEKNARLATAESGARELRERLSDLEAKLAQTTRENEQLSSAQKDLKEQLDTATRLAQSVREQTEVRDERLAQAEVASRDLRKRSEEIARKLAIKVAEKAKDMSSKFPTITVQNT